MASPVDRVTITLVEITLVDISGKEIIQGTWHGQSKANELYQAAYLSKPGFLCKLLHGIQELSPQSDLASLCQPLCQLTVVWMTEAVHKNSQHHGHAFAAVKSDGSVITWGSPDQGGDSSRVEDRLQEGVVQVVGNTYAFAAVKSDGSVITWGSNDYIGYSSRVEHRLQE
ncbi:unnamed protein product, partial [Polarella glacialis]